MKVCNKCKTSKKEADFVLRKRNGTKRRNICIECSRLIAKGYYRRNKKQCNQRSVEGIRQRWNGNRQKLIDYLLDKKCIDCGNTDIRTFDFDHRDKKTKRACVSVLVKRNSWSTVLEEINKCDIRCSNCHRIKTSENQGWFKSLTKKENV